MIAAIFDAEERLGPAVRLDAYFKIVMKENHEALLEAQNMARKSPTMEEVFIQIGFAQRFEERGREQTARNLLKEGLPVETIARAAELPIEKVRALAAEINVPQ
jgi:predicted transposase YdaD